MYGSHGESDVKCILSVSDFVTIVGIYLDKMDFAVTQTKFTEINLRIRNSLEKAPPLAIHWPSTKRITNYFSYRIDQATAIYMMHGSQSFHNFCI
jgi:hypothetical protein